MTTERTVLQRRQREVEIGGRRFTLTEHSAADVQRYLQIQWRSLASSEAVRAALGSADADAVRSAGDEALELEDELMAFILPGTDAAWRTENLVPSIKRELVRIQDELDAMDEVVGNIQRLLPVPPAV